MKKKHLNVILIILAIVIYGSIFLKFFGTNEVELSQNDNFINYQNKNIKLNKNEFKLKALRNNPFRTSRSKVTKVKTQSSNNKNKKKIENSSNSKLSWPSIVYCGFVKNELHTKPLALLKVNNKIYRKREKQSFKGLYIKKVYSDSIIITLNKESKTILKINENKKKLPVD